MPSENEANPETAETIEEFKATSKEDSVLMEACLEREKNGDIKVWIRVADEIEEFFQNENQGQSSHWKSNGDFHEYYKRQYSRGDGSALDTFFSTKVDAYGSNYIDNGRVNCGLLRTIGISEQEGVTFSVPSSYSGETLEESLDELKQIVIELYREFIQPVNVVARVTTREQL